MHNVKWLKRHGFVEGARTEQGERTWSRGAMTVVHGGLDYGVSHWTVEYTDGGTTNMTIRFTYCPLCGGLLE
jgi:hypothetical protein